MPSSMSIFICRSFTTKMANQTEESNYEEAKALLTSYLNKRMRISISDGRVIDGNFLCTDKDCNIVLSNCEEFFSQDDVVQFEKKSVSGHKSCRQPRTLSLAIVPGEHVRSISIAKDREPVKVYQPQPSESSPDTEEDEETALEHSEPKPSMQDNSNSPSKDLS